MLNDETHGGDKLPQHIKNFRGFTTIRSFCTKNGFMKTIGKSMAISVVSFVDSMFSNPEKNPYKGWIGQGNLADLNNKSNSDLYWKKARAYYWLQVNGKVKETYVEMLQAGKNTQVIFDAVSINQYFMKNKLPEKVPKVIQ